MKTTLSTFLAVLSLIAFSLVPATVRAQDAPPPPPPPDAQDDQGGDQGASFQTFYDQLGDQGQWIQTDDYGYVFQPAVTDPNWAPYTDGHWVYTDAGWAWVSDEPWGWATYHYGRWANIDGTGWVWVPGYQWAPAWVSWRYGGGYCGWAPLPPGTFVGVEYGNPGFDAWSTFHFGGDVDVSFGIGAGFYSFVRVGDMGYPNYRGHYADRSRNFVIINNTTNVTNININRNGVNSRAAGANFRGVSVGGPPINEVNAHATQRIQTVQLAAANQPGRSSLQGNTLAVYAPHVNAATLQQARPTRVAQTIAHPTFNRGTSITKPLQVTASVTPAAPTAAAIQAAQTAQLHASAKAKVATEKTVPRTTINKPLTTMSTLSPHPSAVSGAPAANTFKPSTVQHAAAPSPYTGEPVNPKPSVEHSPVNSPYTGETSSSQAEIAQQKKLQQEKLLQQQHTQALQNERESQPVERTPVQPQYQAPVQHTPVQQEVVHPQSQPVVHPQEKPAPEKPAAQPAAKKENENGSGGPAGPGGSGGPYGH